ncbi:MAG: gamma-butyrobetaine hydroxylase-like domain-containing protein [Coraliomargaritaceae bacterium]
MSLQPEKIQIIGGELCIRWPDGTESYFTAEHLRRHSPSAENIGEKDIFGQQYGGQGPKDFPNIRLIGCESVGNYALRPAFSDGHNSGIYSWEYLRDLQ